MKKVLKTKLKDMKAITLVALVITIVVLIILAGVIISITLGNGGIIDRTKTAKEEYTNAQNYEYDLTNNGEDTIEEYVQGGKIYKITYNANGGQGSMSISKGLNSVTVAENSYIYPTTQKVFLCWNTKADGSGINYNPGDSITQNETLYATWGVRPYDVGDAVTLGGETFYVIEKSDSTTTTVKLIAALNVKTTSGEGQYTQREDANTLAFDDDKNDYTSSEIKIQVDAYKTAVEKRMNGGATGPKTIQEARLMLKDEAQALQSEHTDILYGTTPKLAYWLGTPGSRWSDEGTRVNGSGIEDKGVRGNTHTGLRPLFIVLKSNI